ncbi:MAG TPA: hypothetical protein VFX92_03195, partial [Candidatus Krumholzibacteria bacterium]|nr:hypothetical protein [Candidatus Krumholzibacteria bacterium]
KALDHPDTVFQRPADVLSCDELSHDEKIRVLRRWEYDARLLEVAQEENMQSEQPGMLSEILRALQKLHARRIPSGPSKSGGA